MEKTLNENRRESTLIRYRYVHKIYDEVIAELGKFACLVPKSYIYERIKGYTGLSVRTIARALSHRD